MVKLHIQIALLALAIAGSMRCDLVPALEGPITTTQFFNAVNSVNFGVVGDYLAAGLTIVNNVSKIAAYQFNQTAATLSLIGTPVTFGLSSYPVVAWCPNCAYLAAGSQDISNNGIIQLYSFNEEAKLTAIASTYTIVNIGSGSVNSIDWCSSCSIFAVGGVSTSGGIIQVYSFNGTNLSTIGAPISPNAPIKSLKWCDGCNYLATVDRDGNIVVYSFDGHNLTEITKFPTTSVYNTVDWCGSCSFIAAGGEYVSGASGVDIYGFNGATLSFITSATVSTDSSTVCSLQWCQSCNNLAIGAGDFHAGNGILQLYHFDSSLGTLSQPLTNTILTYFAYSIDWCGDNCCYLAVGEGPQNVILPGGQIQIFRGNTCLTAPTGLQAQKIFHRFPTQVDIINQLCWSPAAGAVVYEVYADAALTILLATITNPPLCYSQHQISSGKLVTYYVVAVDADGNHSAPAVVTI